MMEKSNDRMCKAVWAVVPDLRPWLGDTRRNSQPYYYSKGVSGAELQFAQYVKHELQMRGVACYVALVEQGEADLRVH